MLRPVDSFGGKVFDRLGGVQELLASLTTTEAARTPTKG
jgi:hypothetical protein